jgi:hypothetical protein
MSGITSGSIIAAAGLAGQLVAADRRLRAVSLAAFVAGVVVLALDLLSGPFRTIRHDASAHPVFLAALVPAIVLAVVGVLIVRRYPTLTLMAIVAAAPARIPFHAGGQQANLLVPLYGVIALIALSHIYDVATGRETPPRLGAVGWAAAALIGWSAVSLLWTTDSHEGAVEMLFFYLPFGYLLTRLAAPRPGRRQLRLMLYTQVALAGLFAAVAFWQFHSHHLFWNRAVIVGNAYGSFYRVNSLFFDSSVYGRFMAVTIVLLAAVAIYLRATAWLLALIAVLFVAQYLSYSQSAWFALAAGSAVLAVSVLPRRIVLALVAVVAVAGLAGVAISAHGHSARDVTRGRSVLFQDGWRVIRHHPVVGAGLGGFATAARAGSAHPKRTKQSASHTTPLTELAELGPLGFAAYVAMLVAAAWLAFRGGPDRRLRWALGAALATVFASSLFYNAYFEDPASWILTGLIVAVAQLPMTRTSEAPA